MESAVIVADSQGLGFGFARKVYEYIRDKEGRQFPITLADLERTEFLDGEFKLRISHNIRRKKCFFIHDSNRQPCDWVTDLLFALEAMTFSSPSEINVILPYTRFARQDRKDESRVSVNVNAIAGMISRYADRGMTIDLHAPQIQEYFGIPFDNLFSFPVLISHLRRFHPELLKDIVLVSPDAGGGKRVEIFQKKLAKEGIAADMAICYKRRVRDNEVAEIKIMGEVKGMNCLIVDDIIDTGNTLIKTAKVLKQDGAKKIVAYGTHGLFSDGVKKFGDFDKVMVSDSLCCARGENFESISLVDLFGEAIYRTIVGESLSSLFKQ